MAEEKETPKYLVVENREWLDGLQDEVNEFMKLGYVPIGGVTVVTFPDGDAYFYQAMVWQGKIEHPTD